MPLSTDDNQVERLFLQHIMDEQRGQSRQGSIPRAVSSNGNGPVSSPSGSRSVSASPDAPQGSRRITLKLNTKRSPLKDGSRGLTNDDTPQVSFHPGPNSNAPRNYDDLPESAQMAKYIAENKELLGKLVAFEREGYLAHIAFEYPDSPKHTPVNFEDEPEESQKALNDILHENYCLRLRFQCLTNIKRQHRVGVYKSGEEVTMRMYGNYHFKVTFP
ncbi:hypothetical protein L207DRAFT_586163 [Hyaloscypha variabilis F]|uniref:Uncharacterized protein n=1 Tax=Hyaloscypha variabilis (strain UAMH 11265 / GT02V1 / F) TaxID=1149755 RepID=A0A2J6RD69_HYAVF|nr:hypothetical protein L207DRAFT_586163 [Hyaloscypha variabilis F]